ncbi:MAG TPA: hypothetical protein VLH38_04210 [Patescibacteria group bacterium]|nr:hypothetical protein [Patescibacteria group bacterium]
MSAERLGHVPGPVSELSVGTPDGMSAGEWHALLEETNSVPPFTFDSDPIPEEQRIASQVEWNAMLTTDPVDVQNALNEQNVADMNAGVDEARRVEARARTDRDRPDLRETHNRIRTTGITGEDDLEAVKSDLHAYNDVVHEGARLSVDSTIAAEQLRRIEGQYGPNSLEVTRALASEEIGASLSHADLLAHVARAQEDRAQTAPLFERYNAMDAPQLANNIDALRADIAAHPDIEYAIASQVSRAPYLAVELHRGGNYRLDAHPAAASTLASVPPTPSAAHAVPTTFGSFSRVAEHADVVSPREEPQLIDFDGAEQPTQLGLTIHGPYDRRLVVSQQPGPELEPPIVDQFELATGEADWSEPLVVPPSFGEARSSSVSKVPVEVRQRAGQIALKEQSGGPAPWEPLDWLSEDVFSK